MRRIWLGFINYHRLVYTLAETRRHTARQRYTRVPKPVADRVDRAKSFPPLLALAAVQQIHLALPVY
jgi:hypothetical protein